MVATDVPEMYKKMLHVSHQMLKAANGEEWEKLIALEQERTSIVETLQVAPNLVPDDQSERETLIGLIREIQVCDDKIKPRILSWMSELREIFESAGNEVKLGRQYGSF